jgi:hypothetical protein
MGVGGKFDKKSGQDRPRNVRIREISAQMAWTVPVEMKGHPSKATAATAANVRQLVEGAATGCDETASDGAENRSSLSLALPFPVPPQMCMLSV